MEKRSVAVTTFLCDFPTYDAYDASVAPLTTAQTRSADSKSGEEATSLGKQLTAATITDWRTLLGTSEETVQALFRLPGGRRQTQTFAVDSLVQVRWEFMLGSIKLEVKLS